MSNESKFKWVWTDQRKKDFPDFYQRYLENQAKLRKQDDAEPFELDDPYRAEKRRQRINHKLNMELLEDDPNHPDSQEFLQKLLKKRDQARLYRSTHFAKPIPKEKLRQYQKNYREKNREKYNEYQRNYQKNIRDLTKKALELRKQGKL